jgi:hypothetical protein
VYGQLKAYFPDCIINYGKHENLNIVTDEPGFVTDFGLQEEFTRPLAMQEKTPLDPFTGLFGILENLQDGDSVVFQVMFKGAVNPWSESILRSVTIGGGDSFFSDAPEMPKLAQEKVSYPLFAVVMRLLAQSHTQERAQHVLTTVGANLIQMSKGTGNNLIYLSEHGYTNTTHVEDIAERLSHRSGMILNSAELATFVHIPSGIKSKKLEREVKKTKPSPPPTYGHDFILGMNIHQGKEQIVTLEKSHRLKHMHVIGATGTGKSTLLQGCIVQDILLGNGLAVVDPHGDLIESVLPYIPEHRHKDVIIIDPADAEFPVGFNILTAHTDIEKEILASDLVATFRRLSTSWGDQMNSVLANALLAFVESKEGGTLIDLRRFLIEKAYREQFLKTVNDPSIVYYWQKEYPLLKSSSIGSILTRLDGFLRPKLIRNMVAQKKSLNFEDILDSRKILLIKLSQGLIGAENSYLLGTLLVSKIYQSAMARQTQNKADRKEFFLYIDEFQNFICPSLSTILSGTRKYGLGCILAHQDMLQLQKQDSELASSVISNAGTRVCFRVGDIDAKRFEQGFASFEAQDIQNLGIGEAIARVERPEYDFTVSTLQLNEIETEQAESVKNAVIAISRKQYGTPRDVVEKSLEYLKAQTPNEHIQEQLGIEGSKMEAPKAGVEKQEATTNPIEEIFNGDTPNEIPTISSPKDESKTKELLVRRKEVTEHKYLQTLIKKVAQERGYVAHTEKQLSKSRERVDISIEGHNKSIACEIGVNTQADWEIHNIKKCLGFGYDFVIAISPNKKLLQSLKAKLDGHLKINEQNKVLFLAPIEFVAWLDQNVIKANSMERTIKGYRVKAEYNTNTDTTLSAKQELIEKIIFKQND